MGARPGRHLARDPGRAGDGRGAPDARPSRLLPDPRPPRAAGRGDADADAFARGGRSALVGALAAVWGDRRFVRYLWGSLIFQLGNLLYDPIVRAFLSAELHFNYTQCVFIADVLPSTFSLATTPRLGAWLDRTNPLIAWSLIRLGWGIDPLLLALSPIWPAGAMAIAATARLIRGGVMNGSYILWWELGGNYFATRRELTSVYVGASFSVNGVQRMVGPPLGAYLGSVLSRRSVLVIGGLLVLFAAYLARRQAEDEKVDGRYPTFADKEPEPDAPRPASPAAAPSSSRLARPDSPAPVRREQPRRRLEREELQHPAHRPGSLLLPDVTREVSGTRVNPNLRMKRPGHEFPLPF